MQILVNGVAREVPAAATVAVLITDLGLQGQRCAAELNGDLLPRSHWAERVLAEGDRLEVVRAIGGG